MPPPGLRFQSKETEQYHVCLSAPGIPRMDERRFAAAAARRDPRRLGVVTALPGDPREAGDGVLRLHLLLRSTPTPGRSACTSARARRTSPACLEIAVSELADVAAGNVRARRARAGEGEPQGTAPPVARVDVESHDPAREGDRSRTRRCSRAEEIVRRLEAVSAEEVAALADELLAPSRLSAAGIGPDEGRFREAVARVNPALLEAA